jgi:hypothetical protein
MSSARAVSPSGVSQASFYLVDNLAGKGPRVVLLVERRWTSFLKMRAGFPALPFYTRPRRESEPDTHPNGHPWAWVYQPEDCLRDEARWLGADDYAEMKEALAAALHDAKNRIDEQARLKAAANDGLVGGESRHLEITA